MIEITDHGPVRELRLARPPANALNPGLLQRLAQELDAAARSGARALVISGRPGMFTGGLDVPELLQLDRQQMRDAWKVFFDVQARLAASALPVVAAITGHSPAGGAVLALYCDYRVMADGAFKIGLNEVQVGLCPGPVIYAVLRRLVGARHADQVISSGRLLGPAEALEIGLVDRIEPESEVVPAAVAWAQSIAGLPPEAVAATRKFARQDLIDLLQGLGPDDYETMVAAWFSDETQRTMRALVERLKKRG